MQDVAVQAGVSLATVSRALRGADNVRPDTAQRVRRVAAELGFVASRSASSLASGKLDRIAVLIGSPLEDWFSGTVLDGIYPVLRENGYDLILYRVHDAAERAEFFETLPATRNADALVVASFALTAAEHDRLTAMRMPLVYLNQDAPGHSSVSIDDVEAARTGVAHLVRLGHERIAYLHNATEPGFRWSAERRYLGYRAALEDAGLDPERQVRIRLPDGPRFGRQALAELLSAPDTPTAVFAEHDGLAVPLLLALGRAGLRYPDDLSVVGFDDQSSAEPHELTTMAQPAEELARQAARRACALARGDVAGAESLLLPTTLVLRGSTSRYPPRAGEHRAP